MAIPFLELMDVNYFDTGLVSHSSWRNQFLFARTSRNGLPYGLGWQCGEKHPSVGNRVSGARCGMCGFGGGPVSATAEEILGGVRSACTYVGARRLRELSKRTTFVRVTQRVNEVLGNAGVGRVTTGTVGDASAPFGARGHYPDPDLYPAVPSVLTARELALQVDRNDNDRRVAGVCRRCVGGPRGRERASLLRIRQRRALE